MTAGDTPGTAPVDDPPAEQSAAGARVDLAVLALAVLAAVARAACLPCWSW